MIISHKETHLTIAYASLMVVMLLVAASLSLGLIWLRQGITSTAQNIGGLEKEIAVLRQQSNRLDQRIAEAEAPEHLRERIGATFSIPRDSQIVWIGPGSKRRQHLDVREEMLASVNLENAGFRTTFR